MRRAILTGIVGLLRVFDEEWGMHGQYQYCNKSFDEWSGIGDKIKDGAHGRLQRESVGEMSWKASK